MRCLKIVCFLSVSFCVAVAQNSGPAPASSHAAVRFSEDMLDKSIDPCTDFYAYACKKWKAANPIPADQSGWGRFNELEERGEYTVRGILEKYADDDPKRTTVEQKIGDYYQSCMDESAIEKVGTRPLQEGFNRIDELKSKQRLAEELVWLHRRAVGALFTLAQTRILKTLLK